MATPVCNSTRIAVKIEQFATKDLNFLAFKMLLK